MRVIKFRAWVESGGDAELRMAPAFYMVTQGEQHVQTLREFMDVYSGHTLMQFVEKKDWYEGDIISGEYGNQGQPAEHTLLGVIKYRTAEFYIDFPIKSVRIYSVDGNDSHLWREDANFASDKRFYYYQITGMKKVGNIYENPELIK